MPHLMPHKRTFKSMSTAIRIPTPNTCRKDSMPWCDVESHKRSSVSSKVSTPQNSSSRRSRIASPTTSECQSMLTKLIQEQDQLQLTVLRRRAGKMKQSVDYRVDHTFRGEDEQLLNVDKRKEQRQYFQIAPMSIKDFFKAKSANSSASNPRTSPRKSPIKVVEEKPSVEEETMTRSGTCLVKSASKGVSRSKRESPAKRPKPLVIDSSEADEILLEEMQTVINKSPVKEPASSPVKKPSNYREYLQRKSAGPAAPGSKIIPEGAPDCLLGLTFVFTGELSSLSREDAQDLVKRYGGKVTGAPSGRTDFVVVGEGAGPSKLQKIKDLKLNTLDEDGLLALIGNTANNILKEETVVKAKATTTSSSPKKKKVETIPPVSPFIAAESSGELWTTKYAPKCEAQLIGNHSNYEKLVAWLQSWPPTKDNEKAVLISGPPGIGKTTAALMAAKEIGFTTLELNASDTRSKKSLHEEILGITDNRSLAGFFGTNSSSKQRNEYTKQVIIMDEVDGMSAGDRGGMAELIQIIKKSKTPIICICNDRGSPKVRSLANYCLDLRFRRPDARMMTPRISEIAEKEGLKLGTNVIDQLVTSTQGDIRQILNILSSYRLTHTTMNFDESKLIGNGAKKDVDLGPFDAVPALLGSSYDRMSLSEKIDQYFVDNSFVPLMIQENYIKCRPNTQRYLKGKVNGNSFVNLLSAAADSISEADLVDRMIHGSNQEWSLSPFHAIMSTVRPAYFSHGAMTGRVEFTSWLGQNSKRNKNIRLIKELHKHSFLHTHSDLHSFRLYQLPLIERKILHPLIENGAQGIQESINVMDEYLLCREDLDSILEISLSKRYGADAFAKIPSAVKSSFTRTYNQQNHKLPYVVGSGALITKISNTELPAELREEEIDDGDEGAKGDEEEDGTDDVNLSKDKSIKVKNSSLTAKKTSTRGRGRGRGK